MRTDPREHAVFVTIIVLLAALTTRKLVTLTWWNKVTPHCTVELFLLEVKAVTVVQTHKTY